MSFVAVAIGAGVMLAKTELVDQPEAKKQRTLAAATQKFSPWTGLQAQPVSNPNVVGNMMQGAVAGGQMAGANALNNAQVNALGNGNNANIGSSPWSGVSDGSGNSALGNYNFKNAFPTNGM